MIQTFSSTIRRKEMDAVLTCMVDERTGPGELNARLVQAVKEMTGCDGAVAFRSAMVALAYALKALDLPAGSPVMLSALAPSWQYSAVERLGYTPLVLDVSEETGLVTAEIVAEGMKAGGRLLLLHGASQVAPLSPLTKYTKIRIAKRCFASLNMTNGGATLVALIVSL